MAIVTTTGELFRAGGSSCGVLDASARSPPRRGLLRLRMITAEIRRQTAVYEAIDAVYEATDAVYETTDVRAVIDET
jgi:hypothetical protein